MSTFFHYPVTCQVCGQTSKQPVLMSTNSCGYADLDSRPPEMARSTLEYQIQQCPGCGYCAMDLAKPALDVSGILGREDYRAQLVSSSLPPLANRYLCASLIAGGFGQWGNAGWLSLRAAWVCDDARNLEAAVDCRERTVAGFRRELAAGRRFAADAETQHLVLADLLRRAGMFVEAKAEIESALAAGPGEPFDRLLQFEAGLVATGDTACHSAGEVLGDES